MEKRAYPEEDYEATYVTLDYLALKECMKDAIKEALHYERKRRERSIAMYVFFTILFGAMFLWSMANPAFGYGAFQRQSSLAVISMIGLGATQLLFYVWALTRWF